MSLREDEAEFFIEIGEFSKARKSLNQAISIYSSNFEKEKVHKVYLKIQKLNQESLQIDN